MYEGIFLSKAGVVANDGVLHLELKRKDMQTHLPEGDLAIHLPLQLRLNRSPIGVDINQRPGNSGSDKDNAGNNDKDNGEFPHRSSI